MKIRFRLLAGLALLGLLWFVGGYLGLWDVAALVIVGAGLGGVIARPQPPARFKPDTWRREKLAMKTPAG